MGKGFNNYMTKKFFHPGSKENIKRVWMAEQKSEFDKKKQEEMLAQYQREQEMYGNRALLGDEKAKLGLSFMYDPPPGAKKEHVKEDDEPEYKFEWQRKFNAPREKYAKDDDTIRDQPFGIEVRNVRCIKCHKWGHVNTDKICPLFGKNITAEPPQPGMAPKTLMDGMKDDGLAIRSSLLGKRLNPDNPNEQILDGGDDDDPEVQFLKSLTSKQKKKLLKKLDKLAKQQGGQKEKKKKKKDKKKHKKRSNSDSDDSKRSHKDKRKEKKKRKEASSNSSDSDSQSDDEPMFKKSRGLSKHDRKMESDFNSKLHGRSHESPSDTSSNWKEVGHSSRPRGRSPYHEIQRDRERHGAKPHFRSTQGQKRDTERSRTPDKSSRKDMSSRYCRYSDQDRHRSESDDRRDAHSSGNKGWGKTGSHDSNDRLRDNDSGWRTSDRHGSNRDRRYSHERKSSEGHGYWAKGPLNSSKHGTSGTTKSKNELARNRHDSTSSSGSGSGSSSSSSDESDRVDTHKKSRYKSSDSDSSPVHKKNDSGAKNSTSMNRKRRRYDNLTRPRSDSRERQMRYNDSKEKQRSDRRHHNHDRHHHRSRSSSYD